MDKIKTFINLTGLFITIPLAIAQTIILYNYIKAPEILWIIWIINIPISILIQVFGAIATKEKSK